jgi:pyruvate/2-oxoglutarate/acetoin dehydrogenase E1 component
LLTPKQKILIWLLLTKKAISKKYLLKIYKRHLIFKICLNCFGLLDALVMRCASLDTPIPFSIELENNFMPKGWLDEMVQKLLNY